MIAAAVVISVVGMAMISIWKVDVPTLPEPGPPVSSSWDLKDPNRQFPQPLKLAPGTTRFRAADLEAYEARLAAEAQGKAPERA